MTLDNCIIQRISNYFLFFSQNLLWSFFLLFWIWFRLNLLLLFFTYFDEFCNIISKFHFYHHWTLCSILSVSITDRKEMLMKRLTHVGRQYKVILILFIWIVNTISFSCWICKPCDDISIDDFTCSLVFVESFYFERSLSCILDSIVVVYSLVLENYVLVCVSNACWRWWTFYHLLYYLLRIQWSRNRALSIWSLTRLTNSICWRWCLFYQLV